jgi:hypothetical protein
MYEVAKELSAECGMKWFTVVGMYEGSGQRWCEHVQATSAVDAEREAMLAAIERCEGDLLLCATFEGQLDWVDPHTHVLRFKDFKPSIAVFANLEFWPETGLDLVRAWLRSENQDERFKASAALVVVDEPWCHSELQAVLNESDDDMATYECRAALAALPHPNLHQFVFDWEARNLPEQAYGDGLLQVDDRLMQLYVAELRDELISAKKSDSWPTNRRSELLSETHSGRKA